MHQWLLSVVALTYLAAAVGWMRTARSAVERARGLEDLAYRRATHAAQRDVFADRFAERLSSAEASGVPGVAVRSLYEPVEGALDGDFVGVLAVGGRLDVVVGDITGHGFDAAIDAMRLKDLLLAELKAGQSPARALGGWPTPSSPARRCASPYRAPGALAPDGGCPSNRVRPTCRVRRPGSGR